MRYRLALFTSSIFVLVLGTVPKLGAQTCITGDKKGDTCTVTISPSLTIGKTTQLLANSVTTFSLLPSLGMLTATDYIAGFYNTNSVLTVTGRSNAAWGATMASSASFAAPCATKAASQVLWGKTSGARTTPLSTTAAQLFTNSANSATAGLNQDLYFRVNIGWTTDPPNICTLGLTFTINAP